MAPSCNRVEGETVREFAGPNPENPIRITIENLCNLMKFFLQIDKYSEGGLIEIGLKDAVTAIKRAIRSDIQDLISTTNITLCPRTWFKEFTRKRDQPKRGLVHIQRPGRFPLFPIPYPFNRNAFYSF